ncbi:MAG: glutamate--tRNA ligase [Candidatus Woesearchaeota archaeon]|nr:glutamate--tRNA ligase [Candidatus Woesearchaeota archaeon]
MNEKEFEDFVFLQALENAVNFGGKANPKAMLGKVIPKFPEIKEDMQHYTSEIENIVKQVNEMDDKDQKRKLLSLNPKALEKKEKVEKKEGLPDLPDHKGLFIGRFAPAPSGYLHIGHLYNLVFNYEYKKKYGGKFILRFEDTNPEKIDINNYEKIIEDSKWITDDSIDEIYYQSDRLETYYKFLRQLIETKNAYVCECEADVFKAYNDSAEPCPHRDKPLEVQQKKYEKFFNGKYKDGDAVIRFKADLKNKNPALRDFPIARLNSNSHARVGTKYKLWPMYNLCVSIDDSLMNINYVIRGKDAEIGGVRQDMVKDALGLKKSNYFHFGRIKFEDLELGKTPIKEKIDTGIYSGWDDPRVPTLVSFRKRGFRAKAFRDMIIAGGITKRDLKMSEKDYFKQINFFNKQILEKEADRYSFVLNPKEVHIKNINEFPDKEIVLPKHQEFKERGYRKITVKNDYFIDGIDFNNLEEGDIIRLMHFANFKIIEKTKDKLVVEYLSKDYDKNLNAKRNIQFVPRNHNEHQHIELVMQDNQLIKGVTENLDNLKPNENIQFERFGFVKFDHKNKQGKNIFYFTHR